MASSTYESALALAQSLSYEERTRLVEQLSVETSKTRSILEICGLGAEIWQGIDVQEYVRTERASWDE